MLVFEKVIWKLEREAKQERESSSFGYSRKVGLLAQTVRPIGLYKRSGKEGDE